MSDDLSRRISKAIFDSDLIATRLTLSLAEFLWAAMLWWPGDTFGRPTYNGMANVMPEDAWGLIFAASAVTQLSIVAQGHFNRTYARLFAGWNAALWTYVVISMLRSVYPPPAAISGEIALMFAAGWVWVRPGVLYYLYRKAIYVDSSNNEATWPHVDRRKTMPDGVTITLEDVWALTKDTNDRMSALEHQYGYIRSAFVQNDLGKPDYDGHRRAHLSQIKAAEALEGYKQEGAKSVMKAVLGFLGGTISRHSCSSYLLPLASTAVRILSSVRCSLMSCFMGSPFVDGCVRNTIVNRGGLPTRLQFANNPRSFE